MLVLYQITVSFVAILVLLYDVLYRYGPASWHVAWTHWTFTITLTHFILSAASLGNGQLRVLAICCTLCVDAGYWLALYPMRVYKGTHKLKFPDPGGFAKHGGSLLWLLGELALLPCSDVEGEGPPPLQPLTPTETGVVLLTSLAYVAWSIYLYRTTERQVYGAFFRHPAVRCVFIAVSVISAYCPCLGCRSYKEFTDARASCHARHVMTQHNLSDESSPFCTNPTPVQAPPLLYTGFMRATSGGFMPGSCGWWFPLLCIMHTPLHFGLNWQKVSADVAPPQRQ